ncbi:hypothetical protein SDC9_74847 [bioreactor metagenome]|uniref:Uncharacterized protein n=1 Tax=bioreactor metagenome TaxID=1076179 RepID=A0A644YIJ8_9ZZZZ
MNYFAFCTFDLKNANEQDYQNAYADLEKIGLSKIQSASNGNKVVIPTTSVLGIFDSNSAADLRDSVRNEITKAFIARKFKSEVFVLVGKDWAWGTEAT